MKILPVLFILCFLGFHSASAQDTLYLEGRKAPVLVNVLKVKDKYILYRKFPNTSGKILEMKRSRVERLAYQPSPRQAQADSLDLADLKADFIRKPNTVYMGTRGLLGLATVGLYYDRNIFSNEGENVHLGLLVGGGLVNAGETNREFFRTGQFGEIGVRGEFGRNRLYFQTGLNLQYQNWDELEGFEDSAVFVGIPFGLAFRSNRGAYMSAGGEFNSESWAQALFRLRFGWSF